MSSYSFIQPEIVQGTTTSWLPITTPYPSLPGCADAFFLYPGQPAPVGWDPGYGYWAGAQLSCLPPEETAWWEQEHERPDGRTFLSIQPITCPQAFTTAATELRGGSSTMVMCCPSGYELNGGQPGRVVGNCLSPLSSGQEIRYTAQAPNATWVQETLTITTATSILAVAMVGWNVARATSTTAGSPTSTTISAPTSTPSTSRSLTTGAKVGIGVGVGLGVIALLFLVFMFFRRRRRHRTPLQQPLPSQSMPPEADSRHPPKWPAVSEAGAGLTYTDQPSKPSVPHVRRKPIELDTR